MAKLIFPLLLLFLPFAGTCQLDVNYSGTWGIMVQTGPNWFFGDVGGQPGVGKPFAKDWNLLGTTGNFSASGIYNYSDRLAFRLEAAGGKLKSADNYLPMDDKSGRRERNLSFQTPVYEMAVGAQLNYRFFVSYAVDNETIKGQFFPHAFVGIGAFYSDPQARYQEQWVKLRPLRTEGQGMAEYPDRKPYKAVNLFVPVSLGLNYYLNEGLGLHVECIWRKSFTDYVDDVSTRYINPALFDKNLSADGAKLARALHDRSGEINGGRNIGHEGAIRGLESNDSWVSLNFGITYNFWKKKYY
jgi:hypothetical protein